ncbi:mitochondrial glycine transporter Ymc1p [Trichomonascus vanleenenianus]|uniref:mitochondrial glycine transporter Ymc1p n=1 Tax=Trichomonascus vanleenenianus TaxID=2268995 RepID=UPI003ECB2268
MTSYESEIKSQFKPQIAEKPLVEERGQPPRYLGFVAGMFSGVTKNMVGHPFDTVKVRLQTAKDGHFKGPMDCVLQTMRKEGIRGFYKGCTPPLVGWMVMDSVMLGSLHNYRRLIHEHIYPDEKELPFLGKITAGMFAGWTVSFVAAPVEHVKARLQVQYDAKSKLYKGPVNCALTLLRENGLVRGLYRGLIPTMIFRTNFIFWWGSYDIFTKWFEKNMPAMPTTAVNFWAGGLSATVFWVFAYPADVVKQRIMTDNMHNPQYNSWAQAVKGVYRQYGYRGFFKGFVPSILRSFPANAAALAAFEAVMRTLH